MADSNRNDSKARASKRVRNTELFEEDPAGRTVFRLLLVLIPIGAAVSELWLNIGYPLWLRDSATAGSSQVITQVQPSLTPGVNITTTTTIPITSTGALGAFDPALNGAGNINVFLLGVLVFMIAGIVETSLLLVYGAFYVNDPVNNNQMLGLPPGTVRIFLLIIIIFIIAFFALLPNSWGDNKAVVFLFGTLSTVVGFYFGSRRDEETDETAIVRMSLTTKEVAADKFILNCRLSPGFDVTYLGKPPEIMVYLIASDGSVIVDSERVGVLDSTGLVVFDYTDMHPADKNPSTSFIVRVRRPKNIVCDDRVTLSDSTSTAPVVETPQVQP